MEKNTICQKAVYNILVMIKAGAWNSLWTILTVGALLIAQTHSLECSTVEHAISSNPDNTGCFCDYHFTWSGDLCIIDCQSYGNTTGLSNGVDSCPCSYGFEWRDFRRGCEVLPFFNCLPSGYCYRGLTTRGLSVFNIIVVCFLVGIPLLFLIGLIVACFCFPTKIWGPGGYKGWNERRKNKANPIDFRVGQLAAGSFPAVQTEQVIVSQSSVPKNNMRASELRQSSEPMIVPQKEI